MNVWKKWLHVALTVVLTFSLLTPMASATEVENGVESQSAQQLAKVAFEIVGLDKSIYPVQQVSIEQGQTVLDVLKNTLDTNQISKEKNRATPKRQSAIFAINKQFTFKFPKIKNIIKGIDGGAMNDNDKCRTFFSRL